MRCPEYQIRRIRKYVVGRQELVGRRELRVTANRALCGVMKLDSSDGCITLWIHHKSHWVAYYKRVNCMIHELYLNYNKDFPSHKKSDSVELGTWDMRWVQEQVSILRDRVGNNGNFKMQVSGRGRAVSRGGSGSEDKQFGLENTV